MSSDVEIVVSGKNQTQAGFNEAKRDAKKIDKEVVIKVKADADTKLAKAKVAELAASRQATVVQIDADVAKARAKIAELEKLRGTKTTIDVDAEVKLAQAKISALVARRERISLEMNTKPAEDNARRFGSVTRKELTQASQAILSAAGSAVQLAGGLASTQAGLVILAGLASTAVAASGALGVLAGAAAVAGVAVAAIKIGTSGLSAALKTSTADTGAASAANAKAASSATQVASAQKNLSRTYVDTSRANAQAARSVKDAEDELTQARKDATKAMRDQNAEARGGALDQRQAILDVKTATDELRAAQNDTSNSTQDIAQANLNLDKAKFALEQVTARNDDLAVAQKQSAAAGVEGSSQVLAAKRQLGDAIDAEAQTQEQSRRQIQDGQEQLAQAYKAAGAAAVGSASAADKALANLAPSARAVVETIKSLKPAWDDMRRTVQQKLFEGLAGDVRSLAGTYLPVLKSGLGGVATEFNGVAKSVVKMLRETANVKSVSTVMDSSRVATRNLGAAVAPLIQALLDIMAVGSQAFAELTGGAGSAAQRFADFIRNAKESGQLREWMQAGVDVFKEIGRILRDVVGIVVAVFSALQEGGAGVGGMLGPAIATIREFVESAKGQEVFRALGDAISRVATVVSTILKAAFEAIGPMLPPLLDSFAFLAETVMPQLLGVIQLVAPVLQAIAEFIQKNIDWIAPLVTAIGIWAAAQWLLNVALNANPIGVVIMAIGALIAVAALIVKHWEPIKKFFASVWDGITSGLKAAVNGAIWLLNGLIDGVNKIVYGINLVNPFNDIPYVPHVPYLARGGIAGGMAVVGERGAELVKLPQGSQVYGHSQSKSMVANGALGGGTGGGDRVVLELVSSGSRIDDLLVELLRGSIRVRGGNVQTVLGRT